MFSSLISRWLPSLHPAMVYAGPFRLLFSIECHAVDSVLHHRQCYSKVRKSERSRLKQQTARFHLFGRLSTSICSWSMESIAKESKAVLIDIQIDEKSFPGIVCEGIKELSPRHSAWINNFFIPYGWFTAESFYLFCLCNRAKLIEKKIYSRRGVQKSYNDMGRRLNKMLVQSTEDT